MNQSSAKCYMVAVFKLDVNVFTLSLLHSFSRLWEYMLTVNTLPSILASFEVVIVQIPVRVLY